MYNVSIEKHHGVGDEIEQHGLRRVPDVLPLQQQDVIGWKTQQLSQVVILRITTHTTVSSVILTQTTISSVVLAQTAADPQNLSQ